jgi:hypothetical protein
VKQYFKLQFDIDKKCKEKFSLQKKYMKPNSQ